MKMTLFIKSILSCFMILATPSDQIQQIQEMGSPKELAKGDTNVVGEGVKQGQLPIATFSSQSTSFDVSVYIQPEKRCNFGFPGRSGTKVTAPAIKQLAGNTVVFTWVELPDNTVISILDMKNCVNKKIIELKRKSLKPLVVVPFNNGFDVFPSVNSRASYNADGQLNSNAYFPIYSDDFSVSAVSEKSPFNGFFMVDNTHNMLKIIKLNGKFTVNLLHLSTLQAFSNNEQSLYSLCSFDAKTIYAVVHCFQYDEFGKEQWHHRAIFKYGGMLDVKNLAGGGLVFAAYVYDTNQLTFVKMGKNQAKIWSYTAQHTFKGVKLIDFDEKNHMFTLTYVVTRQISQGISEESVLLQKYSFVSQN